MKNIVSTIVLAIVLVLPSAGGNLARAQKKTLNACGCYGDGVTCTCEKKAKCGCPGECEPKGCEEKRQKEMQKEIEAETKKAKEAEEAHKAKTNPKSADDDDDEAAAKAKAPAVKPMTAVMKKQFAKLIDAYLAEHPEGKNKMLWEVRGELP